MNYLVAAALGVLQGVTEFLPVSSTAHLLIAEELLGYQDPGGVFTVMIQPGSMLAVLWLYRARVASLLGGMVTAPGARRFALAIAVACVPALVAGALFGGYIRGAIYRSPAVFATTFVLGGIGILVAERLRPAPDILDAEDTSVSRALGIGFWQMLSLIPGVSRSGATIVGGMLMRLDRAAAAEFAFFLAMPTMAAVFLHDLVEVKDHLAPERAAEIAVGFVAAFVASAIVVGPFLGYVRRAGFAPFAWYRIIVGATMFAAMAAGWMTGFSA